MGTEHDQPKQEEQQPQPRDERERPDRHRDPFYWPPARNAAERMMQLLGEGSILLSIVFVIASAIPAAADHEVCPDAIMLARICAHEAGWESDGTGSWNAEETGDCAAIHEVLYRNAHFRGFSYRASGHAYSGRLLSGTTVRSYYNELDADGTRPPSWPTGSWVTGASGMLQFEPGPSWERYRDRWLELLRYAELLAHSNPEDTSPCAIPVDDWGGRMDAARAERLELIPVDCGHTRNDFYARPSRFGIPTPEVAAEGGSPSSAGPPGPDPDVDADVDPE